tara:strand:- start:93 stop:389 length:297 start_codon:yes stop_codon:yes gene_type:complete
MKLLKISSILFILISLNGCVQSTALIGPGLTLATTGNIMQAGFQYGANTAIKKETGKDTLEHFKDAVENQSKDKKFKDKFTELVKKKYQDARLKLSLN